MPCFHPLPAYRTTSGAVRIGWIKTEAERLREMVLPCGSCLGCLKANARSWAVRCSLELRSHPVACWSTLTYDDDHLPPTLSRLHLSLFMRKLRRKREFGRVRFFGCGEYGERTHRPHYHAILYGVPEDADIQRFWPFGFAQTHTLTPAAISYVAGYVSKKLSFKPERGERIDYETGEVYEFQPPFLQMSRNPGIGGDARKYWRSFRNTAVLDGREVPVPRYLNAAWRANSSEEAIVARQLELEERSFANRHNFTADRLAAGEVIARKNHSLAAERRRM